MKISPIMIICLVVLSGCASSPQTIMDLSYDSEVHNPPPVFIHTESGIGFPDFVAAFKRQSVKFLDTSKKIVVAEYQMQTDDDLILAEVYVYSAPTVNVSDSAAVSDHFDFVRGQIADRLTAERFLMERPVQMVIQGQVRTGIYGVWAFGKRPFEIRARKLKVYLFKVNGWFVRYLVNYADDRAMEAEEESKRFLEGFLRGVY